MFDFLSVSEIFLGFLGGLCLAGLTCWFAWGGKLKNLSLTLQQEAQQRAIIEGHLALFDQTGTELKNLRDAHTTSQMECARLSAILKAQQENFQEKIQLLEAAENRLLLNFKALSAEALKTNNQSFIEMARQSMESFQAQAQGDLTQRHKAIEALTMPLAEGLKALDQKVQEVEKSRIGAYENIKQHIQGVMDTQKELRLETSNLVKALRTPHIRGRWGEIQLKRVVEMAGMLSYCDFFEQVPGEDDAGRRLRPDMIVRLPGEKQIIIDAKVPLSAYLEALEAPDEATRAQKLKDHARHVRTHMTQLSQRAYWDQFSHTPEFVILFLPGEPFFSAALDQDPTLIEYGVDQKVILATPTTLIALLRTVSYGWRQEKMTDNARKIAGLGRDLYKRLGDMGQHFQRLGRSLTGSVESYNQTLATLESRVFVTARRFTELDNLPDGATLPEPLPVSGSVRIAQSDELLTPDDDSLKLVYDQVSPHTNGRKR